MQPLVPASGLLLLQVPQTKLVVLVLRAGAFARLFGELTLLAGALLVAGELTRGPVLLATLETSHGFGWCQAHLALLVKRRLAHSLRPSPNRELLWIGEVASLPLLLVACNKFAITAVLGVRACPATSSLLLVGALAVVL